VLERVDQKVVTEAVGVETGVTGGSELGQVVLPLLLMVHGIPQYDMSNLITGPHWSPPVFPNLSK
tara:strand:- start:2227 stop:2421 length:195 start_codon:yes stop_codon:yes gene_type:complete